MKYLDRISRLIVVLSFLISTIDGFYFQNFTIFSTLRSGSNLDAIQYQIQLNSIWSWSRLVPLENILLFTDDAEACSVIHKSFPNISCTNFPANECIHPIYNRSYVRCAFELAQKSARTSTLLFVNGDIMLDESIAHSISYVSEQLSDFFLVGCRRDYQIPSSINISNPEAILADAKINSKLHSTTGIDLIAFRTKWHINMPSFLVGVYRWDNWLLSEIILRTNITLIDVTSSVLAIHQQPPEELTLTSQNHSARFGAVYNDILTKNASGVDYKLGFIHNAHRILKGSCRENNCMLKDNLNRSEQILIMQRADPNKYIAVLTVSMGYIQMAWNWICWAKRISFRHYILLAEDLESYHLLRSVNEPVYISYNQSLLSNSKSEAEYGSISFQVTMAYRVEFLMRVLRGGFHFLTADMDAIWLSNPFNYVPHDLQITIMGQTHKETKMSGGFILVHATSAGRHFWQNVIDCQRENLKILREGTRGKRPVSDFTEQECINNRLNTTKIRLLDPYLFPDGRSFFDLQLPQRRGIVPVVIHGNWLVGLKNKLTRFENWNLLASINSTCAPLKNGIEYPKSNKGASVKLRIRVLTYIRLKSLQRLLECLVNANYSGDSIALDITVDYPGDNATEEETKSWQELINYVGDNSSQSSNIKWPHGPLSIIKHTKHIGLLGQWTVGTDHPEVQLFLEDDLVLSPDYYIFLKETINFYYMNQSNYDSRLYGLSLQHQHTVIGQRTGRPIKSIEKELADAGSPVFFKYQLLGSWGTVFFPEHWREFLKWLSQVNLNDLHAACIPNLLATDWWLKRYGTGRLWTPWFIRFTFDKGWYSLYTNFPNLEAFATSYREAGLNFNTTRGPMNPLVSKLEPSLHFQFIKDPPLYDFHFTRIYQPGLLSVRPNLWHQNYFFNQCHILDKDHPKTKPTTVKLSNGKKQGQTNAQKQKLQTITPDTRILPVRAMDDTALSPSANCLKLFLLFEMVSVLPIIIVVIALTFFLTRKRSGRRRLHKR